MKSLKNSGAVPKENSNIWSRVILLVIKAQNEIFRVFCGLKHVPDHEECGKGHVWRPGSLMDASEVCSSAK